MNECTYCQRSFSIMTNLRRHMLNIHKVRVGNVKRRVKKDPVFQCSLCDNAFVLKSSLKRHENMIHNSLITPILRNPLRNDSVYDVFVQSDLKNYPILQDVLAEGYYYKIHKVENLGQNMFNTEFEIANCDENVFTVWLSEVEHKSNVNYQMESIKTHEISDSLFNNVYKCMSETHSYAIPYHKHSRCPSMLTMRMEPCNEILITINAILTIEVKAILTFHHYHNHLLGPLKLTNTIGDSQMKLNETSMCFENNCNEEHNEFNGSSRTSSILEVSLENSSYDYCSTEKLIEENNMQFEPESNSLLMNDNIEEISMKNENVELSEIFDNYIYVDIDTENSLHNDDSENELTQQLFFDFDLANERMLQQFKSDPNYFISAIKTYIKTMNSNLNSKNSLLFALESFGK